MFWKHFLNVTKGYKVISTPVCTLTRENWNLSKNGIAYKVTFFGWLMIVVVMWSNLWLDDKRPVKGYGAVCQIEVTSITYRLGVLG